MTDLQRRFAQCLVVVAVIGTVGVLVAPRRALSEMDQLLADYRSYGLPLPPHDACLVRFPHEQRPRDDDSPKDYLLGFRLASSGEREQSPVLVGSVYKVPHDWELPAIIVVNPLTEDLSLVGAELDAASNMELNAGLATAVQCHARGWNDLSRKLLAMSLAEPIGNVYFNRFYQPPDQPPRKALAAMAFAHWAAELTKAELGLAEILPRMRYIIAAHPELGSESNRELLHGIEAVLKPRNSAPGSVESLLDDLTEPTGLPGPVAPYEDGVNPYYLRLAEQGFDAVPALIAHIDDLRLTRRERGMNAFIPATVGHFALLVLKALAPDQQISSRSDAIAWWEQARSIGEEQYLLGHKSEEIWRVLARKYPQHMPEVYLEFLHGPSDYESESWVLAKLVANCKISTELKIAALERAARHPQFVHRVNALAQLPALDPQRFANLLASEFDNAPTTTSGEYGEMSPAARLATLVLETSDPRAWEAMARAARRAEVGLRMDYIQPDGCCGVGERQRSRRIDFLVGFLDDETIRDATASPDKFRGPYAGYEFPKLEVRNLAALELATLLQINEGGKPEWTADDWAQFRTRVRASLAREHVRNEH